MSPTYSKKLQEVVDPACWHYSDSVMRLDGGVNWWISQNWNFDKYDILVEDHSHLFMFPGGVLLWDNTIHVSCIVDMNLVPGSLRWLLLVLALTKFKPHWACMEYFEEFTKLTLSTASKHISVMIDLDCAYIVIPVHWHHHLDSVLCHVSNREKIYFIRYMFLNILHIIW